MARKKLIIAAVTGLFLCAIPSNYRGGEQKVEYRTFPRDLNATILLDRSMYNKRGKAVGFHYAMIQIFEGHSGNVSRIKPPLPDANYWDSLSVGKVDIVVADSVPPHYKEEVIASDLIYGDDRWFVRKDDRLLFNAINSWIAEFRPSKRYSRLVANYSTYYQDRFTDTTRRVSKLSPYDALIRKYSKYIGWDWRLMASVVFEESRFSMGAQSSRDAIGLMQVLNSTARYYGIEDIYNPEMNIKAGALHLQRLSRQYRAMGLDSVNVIKFTLGAYNAGEGRINICMDVTREHGHNPHIWEEVTGCFQYVPDFVGNETVVYVNEIMDRYERYRHIIALEPSMELPSTSPVDSTATDSLKVNTPETGQAQTDSAAIPQTLSLPDSLPL